MSIAPVIETGTPGGTNSVSLPLGGNVLEWSPFALTDFTLDMFGGPGSVVTLSGGQILESSFNLAAGENLINFGPLAVVADSELSVGGTLAGSGAVGGGKGSTISVASAADTEVITLSGSTLNVTGPSNFLAPVVIEDGSVINLTDNLTVAPGQNFSVYSTGEGGPGGVVINTGQATVMGNMMLDANLENTGDNGNAGINITDNGHLTVTSDVTGGAIAITSGTLEFSASPRFLHIGNPVEETASEGYTSLLAFVGQTGELKFDDVPSSTLLLDLTPTDTLSVFTSPTSHFGTQFLGSFQLLSGGTQYSAAEFSVQGTDVMYNHIAQFGR